MQPDKVAVLEAAKENRKMLYRDYVRDEILIRKTEQFASVQGLPEKDRIDVEKQTQSTKMHQADLLVNIALCDVIIQDLEGGEPVRV